MYGVVQGDGVGWSRIVSWAPLSPDLQDMAPMVLSCDGPDELFDSHKLVLNVPLSDSRRVGVFCARGELPGGVSSLPAPSSASQTILLLSTSLPPSIIIL